MVYIYANALVDAGFEVEIIYRCYKSYPNKVKNLLNRICRYTLTKKRITWFPLSDMVKRSMTLQLKNDIADGIIVATAKKTATDVWESGLWKKNKVLYLIQDYETWSESEQEIDETFRYGFHNVVVAKWLKQLVYEKASVMPFYVPNGINVSVFRSWTEYQDRPEHSIAMLYHNQARKGSADGLKAIFELKKKYPDLTAELFGTSKRPDDLPDWVAYTRNAKPSKVAEIFNHCRICFMPSKREGFGLTGLEAMACGAVLISTPCDGVFDYASDQENALIAKGFDYQEFVELTSYCFSRPEVAERLSNKGEETGKTFAMELCQQKMIEYVKSL